MSKKLKIIIAVLVVVAVLCSTIAPTSAIQINRYYGDVDNDGYVTTSDARILLMISAGIYNRTLAGMDFVAADLENDGEITTTDARLCLKTAAGHIAEVLMTGYEFSENHEDFVKIINDERFDNDHKSVKLELSNELCEVARMAAEEYAITGNAFVRKDGSLFYKLLDEKGITYSCVDKMVIYSGYGYQQAAEEMLADMHGNKMLLSSNFSKIGVGAFSLDNRTFYWCVFVMR